LVGQRRAEGGGEQLQKAISLAQKDYGFLIGGFLMGGWLIRSWLEVFCFGREELSLSHQT